MGFLFTQFNGDGEGREDGGRWVYGGVAAGLILLLGMERAGGQYAVPMATVPAAHVQPLGPGYTYRIGQFEVTNEEYAAFLNDARAHPDTPRGMHLAFDEASGRVTLVGDGALLFDPGVGGDIVWDSTLDGGNGLFVVSGVRNRIPVRGVSWFGAVKYCNWLTVVQGMTQPDQRVYQEGPTADDWHPRVVSAATWALGDLNAGERAALAAQYRGYRLPMDDGAATASAFNEWYKAAAWLEGPKRNSVFGFGRDVLGAADANYKGSGDPFEEGPTPAGFYGVDGARAQADPQFGWPAAPPDAYAVAASGNGYGLHDVCGNVAEWMQDQGSAPGDRVTRGGHYGNVGDSTFLRNSGRLPRSAATVLGEVGFRVAQAIAPPQAGEVTVVQDVPRIEGVVGGAVSSPGVTVTVQNFTTQTLDDLMVESSDPALVAVLSTGRSALPGAGVDLVLWLDAGAFGDTESPPAADLVLVRGEDVQAGGPVHDFWIGRTEVTNAQFAAFLNDALSNAQSAGRDARSQHMYFDTDSGSVYVGDQVDGAVGAAAPSGAVTTLMYDATRGRIQLQGSNYVVAAGYGAHPAVGVSWYGAVKYCNWRSLKEGIPADLRAYGEAPAPALGAWRPVSAAAWMPGAFDAAAREQWILETLGYRLPMDEEQGGALLYNEWHKAASARGPEARGFVTFDAVFGFGRDVLEKTDANYLRSGDGFEPGTTPAGAFDGVGRLALESSDCLAEPPEGAATRATANGYGLLDVTGNVAEWVNDFGSTAGQRGVRGGSWRTAAADAAMANGVRSERAADAAADDVGFRVVRGAGRTVAVRVHSPTFGVDETTHVVVHLRRGLRVWPVTETTWTHAYGAQSAAGASYAVYNQSAAAVAVRVTVDVPWLALNSLVLAAVSAQELEGTMGAGWNVPVDVWPTELVAALAPGAHVGTVTVEDETSGVRVARRVWITVSVPAGITEVEGVAGDFHGFPGGPFATSVLSTKFPADTAAFALTNVSGATLDYSWSADAAWLAVEEADALSGTLPPGSPEVVVYARVAAEAAGALPVGAHEARLKARLIDPGNGGLVMDVEHPVLLTVDDWLEVTPGGEWVVTHVPGQTPPAVLPLQLHNRAAGTVDARVCVDRAWLEAEATDVELAAGQVDVIMVSLSAEAEELENDEYVGHIVITDLVSGAEHVRTARLEVNASFAVTPGVDFVTTAVAGGAIRVPAKVYVLTNGGASPRAWSAAVTAGSPWLNVNGQTAVSGTIPPFSSGAVVAAIDAAQAGQLAAGVHNGSVRFDDPAGGVSFARAVTLTVVTPRFAVRESAVLSAAAQPGGPQHSLAMGTYPVTNAEFAAFLNDARAHPTDERGQFMYFDETSGDVYVNFGVVGESGTGAGGRTIKMFAPQVAGQIEWDGSAYQVRTTPWDASEHPAAGVSWYGAVKFANWLTLDQGFAPGQRCYAEHSAALPSGWRPIGVGEAVWAARDLNDAEREVLVTSCPGYRLPMDDGANNVDPARDAADLYNEWFKAAAWDAAAGVHRLYGFGRDVLVSSGPGAGRDANYRCSGDPFEGAADCTAGMTTPVGYYGGASSDPGYLTHANSNAFGLFDLCGNVHVWMQCRYSPHAQGINFRAVRGGSFNDPAGSDLLKTTGRTFTTAAATSRFVGLRVVRALPAVRADLDGNGVVDGLDYLLLATQWTGPRGAPAAVGVAFDLDQDGDVDLADFAQLVVAFD